MCFTNAARMLQKYFKFNSDENLCDEYVVDCELLLSNLICVH